MQKFLIFAAGVATGFYLSRTDVFTLPYRDTCRVPECGHKIRASNPDMLLSGMDRHHKEKHPGWKL